MIGRAMNTLGRSRPRVAPAIAMRRAQERGVSIVELMVGLAIGLVIIAAGLMLLASGMLQQRVLRADSRLMQDLRTTLDLVSRDLRRAGYWGAAVAGPGHGDSAIAANPYRLLSVGSSDVGFSYSRDEVENGSLDPREQLGFRLRQGALEMKLGSSGWQTLSDTGSMVVTAFEVRPTVREVDLTATCEGRCTLARPGCRPHLDLRQLELRLAARSAQDASATRTLTATIRLPNDVIADGCAG